MSIETGGPAFPQWRGGWNVNGMTLRDYFAGEALKIMKIGDFNFPKDYARHAYKMADAMLTERNIV